jgi:hypothetical protein
MAPALARLKNVLPALAALFVGGVFLLFAQSHVEIECARATGTCDYRSTSLGSTDRHPFPMSAVREVRQVDNLGKHNTDAKVVLVFSNGRETAFGLDREDVVRPLYEHMRDFFAPNGSAPTFHYVEPRKVWPWIIGIVLLIAGVVLGVMGWRKPVTVPVELAGARAQRTVGEQVARRNRFILIGGAVLALAATSAVLLYLGNRGKGTLALECKTRCRFDSMECLPGGSSEMALDPGTYTIEVWASSGSALWLPRTFEIVEGETTPFVCGP